ncbi:hypothetical protein LOTGIDRAFT_175599 [Lottia gigantea]|uniref:Uncharacterized protein n=1 Tax=Lottia gigantea TaxID=225164 RepID=V4ADH2_LOTGI|nr:hypothetical protein LOTGIDRAFT_175599 [Lottia gigantea]ESO93175.1 hypothetical protein LOTGIDRAFT_175599 [Lottia gigantea]
MLQSLKSHMDLKVGPGFQDQSSWSLAITGHLNWGVLTDRASLHGMKVLMVRKGKSSDLLFTDEEEQMKRNRRRTDEAAPTEQMKNRKKYEEQVKNAEEKINR